MLIRTRTGVSVDGFFATPDGLPVFVVMPDFVPHESYGWPEFDAQIDAVVLGRVPLDAGLAAKTWALAAEANLRADLAAVPADVPAEVVVAVESPQGQRQRAPRASPTCLSFAVPLARAR
jgi:hypothetical protein